MVAKDRKCWTPRDKSTLLGDEFILVWNRGVSSIWTQPGREEVLESVSGGAPHYGWAGSHSLSLFSGKLSETFHALHRAVICQGFGCVSSGVSLWSLGSRVWNLSTCAPLLGTANPSVPHLPRDSTVRGQLTDEQFDSVWKRSGCQSIFFQPIWHALHSQGSLVPVEQIIAC